MEEKQAWAEEQESGFAEAELIYGDMPDATEGPLQSADDALVACLNHFARVDVNWMSIQAGIPVGELIRELEGTAIFQDPASFLDGQVWCETDGWLAAPRYLCGNLYRKLEQAKKARRRFPGRFQANVDALERRLPQRLTLEDIHVSLGTPWVPEALYSQFITELLDLSKRLSVYYSPELARWIVLGSKESASSLRNYSTFGTEEMSALKIMEDTMNARTVKVYDTVATLSNGTERILNKEQTLLAQEKQRLLMEEFQQWIFGDPQRKRQLEDVYNDHFVGFASSPYDGSFLRLPGLNPQVRLYPHQRNVLARILLSPGNVLMCHDVGAGKTYVMVIAVHELWRMGLSRKNLVVVPNNVLQATAQTHRYLYPQDKIRVISPADFKPEERERLLREMDGDDAVVTYMASSSFDLVRMSKQYWVEELQQKIRSLRSAAENTLRKQERTLLQRQAQLLSKKLQTLIRDETDTPWPSFETLGITTLVVDEAHNYKNIPGESRADNIVGWSRNGSEKAKQLLAKCHSVERVIFATGTPMTNSIADLYAMMTYLQPGELKYWGVDSFDMWINNFAQRVTDFEIDVDGDRMRLMTRFSKFRNLSELMSLFSSVCDFHHIPKTQKELPVFHGYRDILVPRSPLQKAYIRSLAERAERIRNREVQSHEDNLLKVTTDGRKCALDIRLVCPDAREAAEQMTKVQACSREAYRLYRDYPGTCQIIFCDIGTPKSGYNLYDALRQQLVADGIAADQIAFIHDADSESSREKLFADMNTGKKRIVIGSTAKLGVGVNVQQRLIALHHLSIPWKPGDIIQREGRILRQGNLCPEVFIFRYITEGTFDAYSWQLLQNKQQFISNFLAGSSLLREIDDIMDAVLSYAEVKVLAVGNPAIRQRCEVANRLERAKIASRHRVRQLLELRGLVERAPERKARLAALARIAGLDHAAWLAEDRTPMPLAERQSFDEELDWALKENIRQPKARLFDTYQGFDIMLPENMRPEYPYVVLVSSRGGSYPVDMKPGREGAERRLYTTLEQLADRQQKLLAQISELKRRCGQAMEELEKGNPYEAEVTKLEKTLKEIDGSLREEEAA